MLNQPQSRFKWHGVKAGQAINGVVHASNKMAAKIELLKQGIKLEKISKIHPIQVNFGYNTLSSLDILLFTKQLATLHNAGISLIQALDIIIKNQTKQALITLLISIKQQVLTGFTLSESLALHPQYFSTTYLNLLIAGERSGTLATMLTQIEHHLQQLHQTKHQIKKALTYPAMVMVLSIVATVSLLIYVVPQFAALFNSFNAELPLFTRSIIALSQGLLTHWPSLFGGFSISLVGLFLFYKYSSTAAIAFEQFLLSLPIMGSLLQQTFTARYCSTLSIMIASNIPLLESVQLAAASTGSNLHNRASQIVINNLSNGQPLGLALTKIKLYPVMVTQLIIIGEETGMLAPLLSHVAEYYDKLIQTNRDSMIRLIEPCLMILLGLIIGAIIISMYLPLFKLGTVI